ncbi:thioredoxin domain-containing protein [Streptomyces sp. MST-110588]|nr:thioredoxin domain-containing protein [Streptomyces sp. MST-110588]
MKVAAAVAAVLVVAGGVAVWATQGGEDSGSGEVVAAPKGTEGGDKPIVPVGAQDAPSTLTVWEDFRCPACGQFENGFRATIRELEDAGQLKSDYHLATIIDGNMGGRGSLTAGNAALCAQDAGRFRDYHDVLYKNQPPEQSDGFADKKHLIELAGKVDGLVGEKFTRCVNDGTYNDFVRKSNDAFAASGHRGTPTVLLNGKNLADEGDQFTPDAFKKMVQDTAKGKKAAKQTGEGPEKEPGKTPGKEPGKDKEVEKASGEDDGKGTGGRTGKAPGEEVDRAVGGAKTGQAGQAG